jgi:hypothetical protein
VRGLDAPGRRDKSRRGTPEGVRYLAAYAVLNAVLYSVLLPLWEGFDEPFHFGYVQQLANGEGLPDPRVTRLSLEAGTSLLLAPASYQITQNLPQLTSFKEYFFWPRERRAEVHRALHSIPPEQRRETSEFLNYEAQQAPLAYLLLAAAERALAFISLPVRVAILRMLAAAASSLLLLAGGWRLFSQLGMGAPFRFAALFCVLSSQMLWATVAHIGNDWLAVPLGCWMLVALNSYWSKPGVRAAGIAALWLAAGLLTKAYFLAFIPLLAAVCVWRRRWKDVAIAGIIVGVLAGPWYARNIVRYGAITGTQEARAGVDTFTVLRAAPTLDWPVVMWSTIRSSIWTGNNTFLTFSANTLHVVIGAALLGLLLWALGSHRAVEWITAGYCALFMLALAYAAVVSHFFSGGVVSTPMPWHAQVLLTPLMGLAFLGAARWVRAGRVVAALLVLVSAYMLAVTYVVKLIPIYGGYDGRTSLAGVARLYGQEWGMLVENLNMTALAPAAVIFGLTGMVIVFEVMLVAWWFRGGGAADGAGAANLFRQTRGE